MVFTLTKNDGLPNEDFVYKINHKNSFRTLQNIMGYVLRFINHARCKRELRQTQTVLSPTELDHALTIIVRAIQTSDFKDDITHFKKYAEFKRTSPFSSLSPFLDEMNILRVGGRLEASTLPFDAKHQMLLPYNDPITKLILVMLHNDNMHCGPQTLQALSRQRFWIIKGKSMARNVVQGCVRCSRAKPRLLQQIMGNLPASRITQARPFLKTGVDFGGPFWIHYKIRGKKPHKAYIAIFCCFATKAVHLELVNDLTTEAFIGSLKRFTSRRGRCDTLYCDNATNFVGAKNKLQELNDAIFVNISQEKIIKTCSDRGIDFKFIPPRAPHFGGLWEAAVKSAKHLLLRSVSTASLTYEELETVIIEIEAILNSRPITEMSTDPNDLTALTPGHFLIGEPLTAQVDRRSPQSKMSLATRWKLVSQVKHEFWRRWNLEYLNQLQEKRKWKNHSENVRKNELVIIKEDNVPVMQWPLGRIVEVHTGPDGAVRVVDVKTATGIFKRAIHRLAPLPVESGPTLDPTPPSQQNHEEEEDEKSEVPTKRKKFSKNSLITTLVVSLLLLPMILANPVVIKKFENGPGIYFEDVGTAHLATAEWKIVVYYDLTPFWVELEAFTNGTLAYQQLCNQSRQGSGCTALAKHFLHTRTELQLDNELLIRRRKTRAALDIVGNIANSLFGVLDSDYAKEMSKTISQIQNNEAQMVNILKKHTSIIDSTINIIKQNEVSTNTRVNMIQEELATLENAINKETETERRCQVLMSLGLQLSLIATNLQRIQTAILNVLTATHHGKISPLLLSPQQLSDEIINIKNNLPPSKQLPIKKDDLLHFYKLMTSEGGIANNHVIFVIKFPLMDQERFNIFRVIPIPTTINNTLIAIKADTELMATNLHRDHYFPMSLTEIEACLVISESTFLCSNKQSIFNKGSNAFSCEFNLLNNRTSADCKLTNLHDDFVWTQMNHKNQWIYGTKETAQMSAVCGTNAFQIKIEGSGLLSLDPECIIKHNVITIQGHYVIKSTIHSSYAKHGNLTAVAFPSEIRKIFNFSSDSTTKTLEQLTELQNILKSGKISELSELSLSNNIHHYAISYTALVISIIIASCIVWHMKTGAFKKEQPIIVNPIPKPRRHLFESA